MTSLLLMVYMTDIAGVSAGIAGAIYGVTKIWAGVTDLAAGNTVGRRQTRHGRLRPWLIWVSPFLAISLVALFSTPAALGPMATVAWILLFDAAFQLCCSFVNIPYGSLSAAMTENATDRSRLAGARSIGGAVTGVVLSMILSPQFEDTTADGIRLKFTIATLVLAASVISRITERFGKRLGYVGLALVAVAGLVLVGLTPTGNLPLALLAFFLYGIGFGGTNAMMFSMQADTVDYGEWRTGTRAEGGSYSILSFVRKTGQGIGGFLGGGIIAAFGYASGAPEQTEQAVQGIKVAAGWAPACPW